MVFSRLLSAAFLALSLRASVVLSRVGLPLRMFAEFLSRRRRNQCGRVIRCCSYIRRLCFLAMRTVQVRKRNRLLQIRFRVTFGIGWLFLCFVRLLCLLSGRCMLFSIPLVPKLLRGMSLHRDSLVFCRLVVVPTVLIALLFAVFHRASVG